MQMYVEGRKELNSCIRWLRYVRLIHYITTIHVATASHIPVFSFLRIFVWMTVNDWLSFVKIYGIKLLILYILFLRFALIASVFLFHIKMFTCTTCFWTRRYFKLYICMRETHMKTSAPDHFQSLIAYGWWMSMLSYQGTLSTIWSSFVYVTLLWYCLHDDTLFYTTITTRPTNHYILPYHTKPTETDCTTRRNHHHHHHHHYYYSHPTSPHAPTLSPHTSLYFHPLSPAIIPPQHIHTWSLQLIIKGDKNKSEKQVPNKS